MPNEQAFSLMIMTNVQEQMRVLCVRMDRKEGMPPVQVNNFYCFDCFTFTGVLCHRLGTSPPSGHRSKGKERAKAKAKKSKRSKENEWMHSGQRTKFLSFSLSLPPFTYTGERANTPSAFCLHITWTLCMRARRRKAHHTYRTCNNNDKTTTTTTAQ